MAPVTQSPHAEQSAGVDRMEVETFLNEVILDLSVNVIYVVNDLTWPEQQFIDSILNVRRGKKDQKKFEPGVDDILIVVHNWRYQNHDQMESQFKDFVQMCYPVGEKVMLSEAEGIFYWSSKLERGKGAARQTFVIEHFFLASESTGDIAGNRKWNDVSLAQIRRVVTNVPPIIASKSRMIVQEVLGHINERLRKYFVLNDDEKTDLVDLEVVEKPRLVLKNPSRVQRKKHFAAPLCTPRPQKEADLEPVFLAYMTKDYIILRIEVPGLDSLHNVRHTVKHGNLEIVGEKASLEEIEEKKDIRVVLEGNSRYQSGSWVVNVPLRELNDILFEMDLHIAYAKPEEVSLKAGVLVFKYIFGGSSHSTRFLSDEQTALDLEETKKELLLYRSACEKSSKKSWSVCGCCTDFVKRKDEL